jgi:hypothetical protein
VTRGPSLPDRTYLPAIFERLAIPERDREEILLGWPSPATEIWTSLQRTYEALVRDLGGFAPLDLAAPIAPGPVGRYFFVYVYLAALADVRRFHARRRIPDDVSWATLCDLGRNLARDRLLFGEGGLRTSDWLTLHFRGSLYQLGRLQFNRRADTRAARGVGSPADADRALEIHIPESGPLTPEECDRALALAQPFFVEHFAETPTVGVCTSWLLDPQLADYLEASSNVVRFQRRFNLVGEGYDGDASVLRFVFHRITPNIDDLPQRTTLERAIVRHLRAGKHWRNWTGWLWL